MEYVLQTDNLKKRYGKSQVLNGLTMNIPKGAIYGFVYCRNTCHIYGYDGRR